MGRSARMEEIADCELRIADFATQPDVGSNSNTASVGKSAIRNRQSAILTSP
jgi:hypothetical protein